MLTLSYSDGAEAYLSIENIDDFSKTTGHSAQFAILSRSGRLPKWSHRESTPWPFLRNVAFPYFFDITPLPESAANRAPLAQALRFVIIT